MSLGCSTIATIIVAIQFVAKVIPWLYQNIAPLILGPKLRIRNFGAWAVVTGASDGIGKSFAKQLAQQGLNMVLISRTQSKLEKVAAEIESEHKVQTKIVTIDFNGGIEIYEKIAKEIESINIGILINNVSVFYEYPEFFLDVEDGLYDQMIRCNIASVVNMTKVVLPQMLINQKGTIINISSIAATVPSPLMSVYSATKAFVDKFSEEINTEYCSKGIIVQTIAPAMVQTNMCRMPRNFFCTTPDEYVTAALRSIGYANRTTGHLPHILLLVILTTFDNHVPGFRKFMLILKQKQKMEAISARKLEKSRN